MIPVRPLVSICVCTFRRPDMLARLLEVICSDLSPTSPTEVLVVDNDPAGSADTVVKRFSVRTPVLRYFREPIQNISLARNRAIAEAKGEWIALIDDDEEPVSTWLPSLMSTAKATNADAVFGPVLPRFPQNAPRWIIDGKFFNRPRFPTGSHVSSADARTGNVLLKASILKDLPGPFDPDFGLTGGEDSILFDRLSTDGKRFVWCDEAVVHEHIASDRLSARWLLRRSFRTGQTTTHVFLNPGHTDRPKLLSRFSYFSRSFFILLAATLLTFLTLPFGKSIILKWARISTTQTGKLTPSSIFKCEEYKHQ